MAPGACVRKLCGCLLGAAMAPGACERKLCGVCGEFF